MTMKGDVSCQWKHFKQAWEYYYVATELKEKDKTVKAAALCSVMGGDCVQIMNCLITLMEDDKKDPAQIIAKLGDYFMAQRHLLFERRKSIRKMKQIVSAPRDM